VSLLVAGGMFALARLVGRLVLERQFGRVRRTARGAHMVAGIFLVGVGVAHLRQTEWVMTAFNWTVGLFS
jgi:cytochrome c biogenesis protein CcdA